MFICRENYEKFVYIRPGADWEYDILDGRGSVHPLDAEFISAFMWLKVIKLYDT